MSRLPRRASRRLTALVAVVVFVAAVVGVVGLVAFGGPAMMPISAQFPEAPGLYPGNHVEVLGISVGTITGVHPGPSYVTVTMSVRADLRLPAQVGAQLVAPEVVSDRFVQLSPAYTGGPRAAAGTVIPPTRTLVPLSVDQILSSLNQLVVALGPTGANRNGALSQLLGQLATTLQGQGPNINGTITGLGQTLNGLSSSSPQLTQLLDNLGTFTKAAASDDSNYQQFATSLSSVSSELAGDDNDIAVALHNLQLALGQLTQFLETNGQDLGSAAGSLQVFAGAVAREQQQLSQLLTDAPLALQNVSAAVDTTAPGGPALRGRYDPTTGTAALEQTVCGDPLLRLLIVTTGQSHPTAGDLACGFASAVDSLGSVPGATAPDLTLAGLAGGGS